MYLRLQYYYRLRLISFGILVNLKFQHTLIVTSLSSILSSYSYFCHSVALAASRKGSSLQNNRSVYIRKNFVHRFFLMYRGYDCFIFRRSEEHTSELQSRGHLVCRLLLKKKKATTSKN